MPYNKLYYCPYLDKLYLLFYRDYNVRLYDNEETLFMIGELFDTFIGSYFIYIGEL